MLILYIPWTVYSNYYVDWELKIIIINYICKINDYNYTVLI